MSGHKMRMQKPWTIWRLVLHVMASGLIGGATAVVAWILIGLLYGFATGLTENNLAISVAEKTFHGAAEGILWAPLGALVAAAFTFLRLLWVNTTNKKQLVRAYSVAAIIALVFWSAICFKSHRDKIAIRRRYLEFCLNILDGRNQDAYLLMSPKYRQTHTIREFQEDAELQFSLFQEIEIVGCDLGSESSIDTAGHRATIYPEQNHFLTWYVGPAYDWERIEGEWYFTGESEWYVD